MLSWKDMNLFCHIEILFKVVKFMFFMFRTKTSRPSGAATSAASREVPIEVIARVVTTGGPITEADKTVFRDQHYSMLYLDNSRFGLSANGIERLRELIGGDNPQLRDVFFKITSDVITMDIAQAIMRLVSSTNVSHVTVTVASVSNGKIIDQDANQHITAAIDDIAKRQQRRIFLGINGASRTYYITTERTNITQRNVAM